MYWRQADRGPVMGFINHEVKMHVNDVSGCPSCLDKLKYCHPYLTEFYNFVKSNHVDAHISWGFRDQMSQHMAYQTGKSKLDWPLSPHNHMDNGQPVSHAIDLFRLDIDGMAYFEALFYHKIWTETQDNGYQIEWGGTYRHLLDLDHFQLIIT